MSKMQRVKGKVFEREIARLLRERWPGADVHRSSQADRARNSDVVVVGGPLAASSLWLELQDAARPTPEKKLEQAERDVQAGGGERLPVVIWHKLREREIWATCRLQTLVTLGDMAQGRQVLWPHVVTMPLEDFLDVVETAS